MAKSYIFGGGTPWTYEELQSKRKIVEELMRRNGTPRNVGEGLNELGKGIAAAILNKKVATRESELRDEFNSSWEDFLASFGGGGTSMFGGSYSGQPGGGSPAYAEPDPMAPQAIADDAMRALGKPLISPNIEYDPNNPEKLAADTMAALGKKPMYIKYDNAGATRNQPLSPELTKALSFLPELGIEARVVSGGQPAIGSGGPRTGSVRHDLGGAGDLDFYKDGRRLSTENPEDLPIFREIVRRSVGAGLTGMGEGADYMGAGRMHLGYGAPAVWGAGGSSANAPSWLREAYASAVDEYGVPKQTAGGGSDAVVAGLVARGLPEHVARGFAMNFQDESGMRTDINEAAPIVPGSRGGYGLAQWTGPRRVALEEFAATRGKPVSDLDTQLDFLMTELQGSERGAFDAIMSTKTPEDAAVAVLNEFERPAEVHRARREAQYRGGRSPVMSDAQPPSAGGYGAPAGMPPANMQTIMKLAEFASNPMATPGQRAVAEVLMQQTMAQMQPQAPQEPDWQWIDGMGMVDMNNPPPEMLAGNYQEPQEAAKPINVGGVLLDPVTYEPIFDSRQGPPQTNVTTNVTTGPESNVWGNPPKDMIWLRDQTGEVITEPDASGRGVRPVAVPIAGSEIDVNRTAEAEGEDRKNEQQRLKLGTTLTSLDLNIREIEDGGLPVTGAFGDFRRTGIGRTLTGSSAVDFGNRTSQITDSAAFAEIQNMRDNSPTGGAVGQLTDDERRAIGNSVTALNNSTSAEEYLRAAKAYRQLALDLAFGEGNWQLTGEGEVIVGQGVKDATETQAPDADGWVTLPNGMRVREKK